MALGIKWVELIIFEPDMTLIDDSQPDLAESWVQSDCDYDDASTFYCGVKEEFRPTKYLTLDARIGVPFSSFLNDGASNILSSSQFFCKGRGSNFIRWFG